MSKRYSTFITAAAALSEPPRSEDWLAVTRNGVTYHRSLTLSSDGGYSYEEPLTGDTLTATAGLGAFVCDPAAPIAALEVVMPPTAIDDQKFEVSTTETVEAFTATAAAGQSILGGGPFMLSGNGGVGWRYIGDIDTWIRRF